MRGRKLIIIFNMERVSCYVWLELHCEPKKRTKMFSDIRPTKPDRL